jgi:type I restriction enzyme R subunit
MSFSRYPAYKDSGVAGLGEVAEIIERVNDLFTSDLSEQDKLVYVNHVIGGKLLESTTLQNQASNNSKVQMSNSPDVSKALTNAVMQSMDAHTSMATQALNSPAGMREILMNQGGLYEALRAQGDMTR